MNYETPIEIIEENNTPDISYMSYGKFNCPNTDCDGDNAYYDPSMEINICPDCGTEF